LRPNDGIRNLHLLCYRLTGRISLMDTIVGLIWLVILGGIYFAPTVIAFRRGQVNAAPIFIVNLFFGWTLVGWVVCFAWALSANTKPQPVVKTKV